MAGSNAPPNSSVYLGDLAETVTEQLIYDVFAQAGTIQSVRLCRDSSSRKPLGYAYVNYAAPADASRALESLNHVELCGRQVRLMPSQRDPSARRSGVGNVFAKNLDPEKVTNKILHETFERFGRVLSAKVATDGSGKSKGYGFVQFADPTSAQKAIDGLNLTDLCGQQLFVGPFIPAKDRAAEPGKFCNVYVRNVGSDVDEETLRTAFGAFGPITSTVVMRNKSGKSRGFGFVNFENADHAARAVAEMDGYRHSGVKWRVNRAQKRNEELEGNQRHLGLVRSNVYLRNLDPSCTDEELRELFQEFGVVEKARVLKDPAGRSKGVGFVQFAEPEDAEAAITGLNGKTMGNSPKPLFVTLAQRKQEAAQGMVLGSIPEGPFGLTHGGSVAMPLHMGGLLPPNLAFFPPSPQFYYGPMPVPLASPPLVSPYFVSMGSGPLLNQSPVMDRRGSLVSALSCQYSGMGTAPSAPLPGPGAPGSGIVSINSGPLPINLGEGHASAPLPMYGGLMSEGHGRGRKMRARGGLYNPQVLPNPPAVPAQPPPGGSRRVLTSPFSTVQAVPPSFLPPPARDPCRTSGMHPRNSTRSSSLSNASSSATTPSMLPNAMSPAAAKDAAAAQRCSDQRRILRDYVSIKSSLWADEVTKMLMERLNPPQIATLLTDSNALAMKVDACIANLEANDAGASPACVVEQSTDAESERAAAQCIPVQAT